jgi:nitrite reductase (NADH) small subunit
MVGFKKVCSVNDLVKNSGVAALVESIQIALFYVDGEVYALNNFDPVGKAFVMSRGMVGDLNGHLMVAAPLYKQHYSLKTGKNIDDEDAPSIEAYETKIENKQVLVKI